MKDPAAVDDDGLAGHGVVAADGGHYVRAVVLVRGFLQERAGGGALDLLGAEIRSSACRCASNAPLCMLRGRH
jgi:hypothetical protein